MAVYKLILADRRGPDGPGYPQLLEARKLGRLATAWYQFRHRRSGGKSPPTDSTMRALTDGSFEIAVPIPSHLQESLVTDLLGFPVRKPVKLVFCFDHPAAEDKAVEV